MWVFKEGNKLAVGEHLTDNDRLQLTRKAKLLEKKARELYEDGEYERAGLLYGWAGYAYTQLQTWEDAGYDYGQSGESYRRNGNWTKAGLSYSLSGEAYERAEKWLGAGLNYSQSGYAYEQNSEFGKAGESYRRAGEAYKETGKWREVALSYQHSGEACRTARTWRAAGLSYAQSGNAYKNASMWPGAEESYCNAKMAYAEAGAYEDSGNMYYQEMVMKRMRMKKPSLKRFIHYLYDLLCGYGEKPKNVVISWIFIIVFFALVYLFPSGLNYSGTSQVSDSFLANAFYSLYFSVITFATLGYSDFEPKGYMRPFVMVEALLGIFMIVLFVLVFGRKMMRR
jgi:tetratricopeptide (TPR) repeat protein